MSKPPPLPTITTAEWLAELERLGALETDEGYTAKELAQRWGKSTKWVKERLAKARDAGLLVRGTRPYEGINGRIQPVPVYRIVTQQGATP